MPVRRFALPALLAVGLVGAAHAQDPLTADQFDALTLGRTMTWSEFGRVYGVEQYLPDRRVRWTFLGDVCDTGHWYPQGTAICFQYDTNPGPVCWEISETATGLAAHLVGDPPDIAPVQIVDTTEPLACFGPEVGV